MAYVNENNKFVTQKRWDFVGFQEGYYYFNSKQVYQFSSMTEIDANINRIEKDLLAKNKENCSITIISYEVREVIKMPFFEYHKT